MEEEIERRINWINARVDVSPSIKDYIAFQMLDFAKYYHEQQVKNCDLADVGGNEVALPDCSCLKCKPNEFPNLRFNVCPKCGNKRCPHASDHNYECTNSNDVGQTGSVY
jgi:hypothetical protein